MIIDRVTLPYLCRSEETIRKGLEKINSNSSRIIFVVDSHGVLEGVLTDGDFRRWVLNQTTFDLNRAVGEIANSSYRFANEGDSYDKINSILDQNRGIDFIPIVDAQKRLVALARQRRLGVNIDRFTISDDSPAFVIAEIGNNHNGSLELAMKLIDEAKACGVDCVKFQMRDMASLYRNSGNSNDDSADLGAQYTLDLLARFQLSNEAMFKAFDYAKSLGLFPLCTPWDHPSLEALDRYGMPAFKIASADLTNHDLLIAAAKKGKPLLVSTGMSTEEEITDSVKILRENGAQYVLLHCNSTYPAPFKDLNLRYMCRLKEIGKSLVGYSSHDRGINACIAAVAMGAKVIEKHFTLDRTMEGNDHRVSLEPEDFRHLVSAIREVENSLGSDQLKKLSVGELLNREILGKSLTAARDIDEGQVISIDDCMVRSPGQGLKPYYRDRLVGTSARRKIRKGECFFPSDIGLEAKGARDYKFSRPFGIPVRFHDFESLILKTNADLVEFHLSYKDLVADYDKYLKGEHPHALVVHAPELFENDFIVDLCSDDEAVRKRSVSEMQRVVGLTRALKKYFPKTERPRIITNVGGFTADHFLPEGERKKRYKVLEKSLAEIDANGVEIIIQTMPPFPWHFGGQRYHNLFMHASEIKAFCEKHRMRICFDISHSKLACNHFGWSINDFVKTVAPFVAHLHISDADGVDGEGLQLGSGSIDFIALGKLLNESMPKASFIPEIWQGHKNGGEQFWFALDQLERQLKVE